MLLRDALLGWRYGQGSAPPEQVTHGLAMPRTPTWRVPLAEYRDNLDDIARIVDGRVAYLVLPCIRDPEQGEVGDYRDAWREAMRDAAERHGAPLAEAPPAFHGKDANALFLDEVHPSVAGHALVAEVLAEALGDWAAAAGGE